MEPDAQVQQAEPKPRAERSPKDMALSLAVLLIPIALLLVFYRVFLNGDAPTDVDPGSTIQEAQHAAVFPVLVPTGLSKGWHVSSATWQKENQGATLRIGYVGPGKDPVQLIESSVAPDTLLPAELSKNAKPTGQFRSAAGAWRLYSGRPGEQALVLAGDGRTVIVVGKTGTKNLEQLASALQ